MDLAVWRDVALIWLILLALISVLPVAIVSFFAIRGLHRLRQVAKRYLPLAAQKARLVADKVELVSQKVTGPIVGVQTRAAQVNGITNAIWRRGKTR